MSVPSVPRFLVSFFVPLLITCTPLPGQVDVHSIADKVDQHYNQMRTMVAEFTESYSGAGINRHESGTLELKKPGRMRWDYTEPRPKMFLTDGKTAWFYVPGERQARRAAVKEISDLRSPLRYLLGKTKLQKEFEGLAINANAKPVNPDSIVLKGVPKSMQDRVSEVTLEVSPQGLINRIVVEEMDGSVTEFRFLQQKENVQISDVRFRFVPPPGVEVVQGTELVQ